MTLPLKSLHRRGKRRYKCLTIVYDVIKFEQVMTARIIDFISSVFVVLFS